MSEPQSAESLPRRCYLCKRDLPLASFRTITTRQKRGAKVYTYRGPSSDCRDCNREYKRQQRQRKAAEEGRPFEQRGDRATWEAQRRAAREQRKVDRRAAWAFCLAVRALVRLSPEERRIKAAAEGVRRQRERYNTDPSYQAVRKAMKIRRKRAMVGTAVVPVDRERVAQRDGWRCGLCGEPVTRDTWSLDHVMPLSRGGEHTYENVQLAHLSCNSRKGDRTHDVRPPQPTRPPPPAGHRFLPARPPSG